jgi:DNA invertase Pin-like site-specific DNA recombinase
MQEGNLEPGLRRRPGSNNVTFDRKPLDGVFGMHREFSVLLVAVFDRVAPSTKNFLEIVDELHDLEIEFISAREAIDTSTPMGKMFITLIGSIAELEKSILVERIRAGMRRARLEGQRLGRAPLDIDRSAIVSDRLSGLSLT